MLFQDEVQYYALDGQEYSVIQANEEIVVSTEARMPHEEQQLVIEEATPHVVMTPVQPQAGKAKGRAAKRKNSASASEPPKTYSRRGGAQPQQQQQQQQQQQLQQRGVPTKKLLLSDDHSTFSASNAKQVQNLQHHLLQQQQQQQEGGQMTVPVSAISFVTSSGQTHHVTSANHHIDLQHGKAIFYQGAAHKGRH